MATGAGETILTVKRPKQRVLPFLAAGAFSHFEDDTDSPQNQLRALVAWSTSTSLGIGQPLM
jgi:hypothetical protein